jgi:endonuclease/exonuclease/phosphatase family metal-dependent hydrolase
MAGGSNRRLWQPVAAVCCLACAIIVVAAGSAASHPTRPAGVTGLRPVRMLQLNLCDSGIASCYSGRSVQQARELIRVERPGVISLNEVCRSDVVMLKQTLAETDGGATVVSAFEAASDRSTSGAFRCLNGEQYGIAIVARVGRSGDRVQRYGAVYPVQDTSDPEERVWLCIRPPGGFYICSTHLANANTTVALAQCRYLVGTALPSVLLSGGRAPMLLGGDFNLRADGSPDVQACLPSGSPRADDGGVQHVVGINGFTVRSSSSINMHGTTDHPGLVVTLVMTQ